MLSSNEDIMCHRPPYNHLPSLKIPTPKIIQFIEFTFCTNTFAKNYRQKNHKILTTHQQHHIQRMDCSPIHGLSCRRKNHRIHSIYEKIGNQIKTPYHKNQEPFKEINIIATQYAHSIQSSWTNNKKQTTNHRLSQPALFINWKIIMETKGQGMKCALHHANI